MHDGRNNYTSMLETLYDLKCCKSNETKGELSFRKVNHDGGVFGGFLSKATRLEVPTHSELRISVPNLRARLGAI